MEPMAKARKPDDAPIGLPGDAAPDAAATGTGFEVGRQAIQDALRTIPGSPGVYRMIDAAGEVLYVGKARNLKNRVQNYANPRGLSTRLMRMVGATRALEVVVTHTEVEALLLESNLIKRLKPRYNILLRDDKSFPFILLRTGHDWAQLVKHRGARSSKGSYFGPFASAGAVNRTINTLQRAFPLRSCSDSVFESRTRPCLQYQIKRCTGPCVGRIGREDYDRLVGDAHAFLSGRSQGVQHDLQARMAEASERLDYESAAAYRDRLRALAHIQSHQGINVAKVEEADVIALHQDGGQTCIQVFFFRAGQNWGNRAFFPTHGRDDADADVLAAFLGQFYDDKPPPREILLSEAPAGAALIAEALSVKADRRVALLVPQRGTKRELVEHARQNAREALARRFAETSAQAKLLEQVGELFGTEAPPQRIEVYDNSHIQGTNAVGAMIVAGPEGFRRNAYRKFNIRGEDLKPGDDYAMMREVLTRRFARLIRAEQAAAEDDASEQAAEDRRVGGEWPDLVLIDGGLGQLAAARQVLEELGIVGLPVAGIAKGPERDAGRERIFRPDRPPFTLDARSPVLYFLQRLRDEAHRFAIGTHRAKRQNAAGRSTLDEIAGVGPRRKRALLNHFGSARAVSRAGLTDLEAVPGVSATVAKAVYDHFHGGN